MIVWGTYKDAPAGSKPSCYSTLTPGRPSGAWVVCSPPEDAQFFVEVVPKGGQTRLAQIFDVRSKGYQESVAKNPDWEVYKEPAPLEAANPGSFKDTNPKDAVGIRKSPLSCLPIRVLWRVGLAMFEGALKYGRHNYRAAGVRASVYFDASLRHKFSWWEGEDIDPDSMLHHIDKEIATLFVLRDAILGGNWVDDRPPRGQSDMQELHELAGALIDRHADKSPHHYTIKDEI